jgi:hypothetical protein
MSSLILSLLLTLSASAQNTSAAPSASNSAWERLHTLIGTQIAKTDPDGYRRHSLGTYTFQFRP